MKQLLLLLIITTTSVTAIGQTIKFEKAVLSDSSALDLTMTNLAEAYINYAASKNITMEPNDRFRIELLAGDFQASIETIKTLRETSNFEGSHPVLMQYELFSKAKIEQINSGDNFSDAYRSVIRNYIISCDDVKASSILVSFTTYDAVRQFTTSFQSRYIQAPTDALSPDEALDLLKAYFLYHIYSSTEPILYEETERDENSRYLIREELITSARDGAEISVITVRKRNTIPLPAILIFTIYADNSNKNQAMLAASKGYAGVIATSRGKRQSHDPIEPYKYEHKDVYAVIDWISQQPWNNGKVGMYGGSYNGFTQWASLKEKVHPALKTIVPSVSAAPGLDVPMENNIFYNFPYKWIPYVTNNKFLDNEANNDRDRWNHLQNTWFISGRPYNKMDSIDGMSNPVFQEWISHPGYDDFWQQMIPYQDEFAHIDIPILTTTGYYDDGQRGAMYYYTEHLKHNPGAEHYLLIGPYDHWGAQSVPSANLRGYEIDTVAAIHIRDGLVFDWFDYILKGKEKPSILKDKVNFEVMGENRWLHAPSLNEMGNDSLTYYLSNNKIGETYSLSTRENKAQNPLNLTIDFADRSIANNADYYPWPIITDSINLNDGLVFKTTPFEKEVIINGSFKGELHVTANKKDFDFSINLYELTPEGKYFHLSYYIGRASYSKSREIRELLTPGVETTIAFNNTRIVSKKIAKGSQLVAIVNGNKNPYAQINYGSGKDVSTESIDDSKYPLVLKISPASKLFLPIWQEHQ